MTELTGVDAAFGYGDSILVGSLVRLRGVLRRRPADAGEVGDGSWADDHADELGSPAV